jgi:hypothetical protein
MFNTINGKYYVIQRAYQDYNPIIVGINENKITELKFEGTFIEELSPYEQEALKGKNLDESIKFILALNSINYQYWSKDERGFTRYTNNGLTGALAAFDGFIQLWNRFSVDHEFYKKINKPLMQEFFGDIPEKESRIAIFKESLNPTNLHRALNIVKRHLNDGLIDTQSATEVAQVLPLSFNEPYLKKIQLALYEIVLHYNKEFADKNKEPVKELLTVAADYQLPKVLEAMNLLSYSPELKARIDNYDLIASDSKEELAIRSATIIICEKIAQYHRLSIPAVDRWLWLARNDFGDKKFHLTRTTAY